MGFQPDMKLAVERYRDMVFRVVFTYLRDPADADDVTQDVFVKLLRFTGSFNGEEHLRRWLVRVTVNECKSLFRKPWRRVEDIEAYANSLAMPTQGHADLFVAAMNQLHAPDDVYERVMERARGAKRKRRGTARPLAVVGTAALIAAAGVGGTAYAVVNSDFFPTCHGRPWHR